MWRRVWLREPKGARKSYERCWYDDAGRLRSCAVGPDSRVAESERRKWELALNSGEAVEMQRMTLSQWRTEHLELIARRVQPATVSEHRAALEEFERFVGDIRLDRLSERTCEEWFAARLAKVRPAMKNTPERPLSVATANKSLRTLKGIFQSAVGRYVVANPFAGITPVREVRKVPRIISVEQMHSILTVADPVWRAFVQLAVTTGMRQAELTNLTWADVDLAARTVTVRCGAGHRTKSGKEAVMLLRADTAELLRRIMPEKAEGLVFLTGAGTAFKHNLLRKWRWVQRRAGIAAAPFTLHDLRRSFGTALSKRARVKDLQGAMRHESLETTMGYYIAESRDDLRSAVEGLDYNVPPAIMAESWHSPIVNLGARTA